MYAAAGSPARVYRLTPDGKASIIFAPQELQVQALVVDSAGAIYAATSPDGKVYKLVRGGPAPGKTPEGSHTTAEVAAAQEGAKPGPAGQAPRPSVAVDPGYSASVYFDPADEVHLGAGARSAKAGSMSAPAIAARFSAWTVAGRAACSSRATKPTFAPSTSTITAT